MPRRTAAEAAQTRLDILASARELFASKGYTGVSVPDIAAKLAAPAPAPLNGSSRR